MDPTSSKYKIKNNISTKKVLSSRFYEIVQEDLNLRLCS